MGVVNFARIAGLLAGATLVVATAACGGGSTPAPTPSDTGTALAIPSVADKVTAEVIPIVDVAPIYLGQQQGIFSKYGIDLTLDTAGGGASIIPGVVSGQYQFGFSNAPSLLEAQTQGLPIKEVAPGNATTGTPGADFSGLVVKDPSITSAKDLEGKTIAANTATGLVELSIRALVDKAGGDGSKVNVVAINFPDMVAALDNNQVDGFLAVEPTLSAAKAKGWKVIGDFATIDPKMTVAFYFTSTTLAQANPNLVARFNAAILESEQYATAHQDEVRTIVGTYTTVPASVLAGITLPAWPTSVDASSLTTLAQLIAKYKEADSLPDVNAFLPAS